MRGSRPSASAPGGPQGVGGGGAPLSSELSRLIASGRLAEATAEAATIDDAQVGRIVIPLAAIEKANVDYDFSRPAGTPHAPA